MKLWGFSSWRRREVKGKEFKARGVGGCYGAGGRRREAGANDTARPQNPRKCVAMRRQRLQSFTERRDGAEEGWGSSARIPSTLRGSRRASRAWEAAGGQRETRCRLCSRRRRAVLGRQRGDDERGRPNSATSVCQVTTFPNVQRAPCPAS